MCATVLKICSQWKQLARVDVTIKCPAQYNTHCLCITITFRFHGYTWFVTESHLGYHCYGSLVCGDVTTPALIGWLGQIWFAWKPSETPSYLKIVPRDGRLNMIHMMCFTLLLLKMIDLSYVYNKIKAQYFSNSWVSWNAWWTICLPIIWCRISKLFNIYKYKRWYQQNGWNR